MKSIRKEPAAKKPAAVKLRDDFMVAPGIFLALLCNVGAMWQDYELQTFEEIIARQGRTILLI